MSARFAPKGTIPEWQMIYQLLEHAEAGDVITYVQLEELLARKFAVNRGPLYRARREFGELRKHWLEAVPNVGYRVIEPTEHVRLSAGARRKSRRQVGMAIRILESTDLTQLTGDALAKWDADSKMTFTLWAIFAHEAHLRRIDDVLRRAGLL